MGANTWGAPKDLLEAIHKISGYELFIETGTYLGDTTLMACGIYDKVISIEVDPKRSMVTQEKLEKAGFTAPKVELHVGDSPDVLYNVCREYADEAGKVFWLDAHWCGEGQEPEQSCPLDEELYAIWQWENSPVILIDDARFFITPRQGRHSWRTWPHLGQIAESLHDIFSTDYFMFVWHDVLGCVAGKLAEPLQEWLHDHP